jgi:L-glyceraldehyde 3-phosphate reductase
LLTAKYLGGIPDDSRAAQNHFFARSMVNAGNLANVRALDRIARERGQTLAQMAIAWVLRQPAITSALIGASRWEQIEECLGALEKLQFSAAELAEIDRHAIEGNLNIWAQSSAHG